MGRVMKITRPIVFLCPFMSLFETSCRFLEEEKRQMSLFGRRMSCFDILSNGILPLNLIYYKIKKWATTFSSHKGKTRFKRILCAAKLDNLNQSD